MHSEVFQKQKSKVGNIIVLFRYGVDDIFRFAPVNPRVGNKNTVDKWPKNFVCFYNR